MLTGGAACSKMYGVFSDEVQSTARLDARRGCCHVRSVVACRLVEGQETPLAKEGP
jgi:hypothetical protein